MGASEECAGALVHPAPPNELTICVSKLGVNCVDFQRTNSGIEQKMYSTPNLLNALFPLKFLIQVHVLGLVVIEQFVLIEED